MFDCSFLSVHFCLSFQFLPSESGISNQSLYFWSFIINFATFNNLSADNHRGDIRALFCEKHFSNFISSLGTKSPNLFSISESRDGFFSFLHNNELEHFDIGSDDATSDGFLLFEAFSSGFKALMTFFHEESYSFIGEYSLDHGKSLFVLASANFKDVSFEGW